MGQNASNNNNIYCLPKTIAIEITENLIKCYVITELFLVVVITTKLDLYLKINFFLFLFIFQIIHIILKKTVIL